MSSDSLVRDGLIWQEYQRVVFSEGARMEHSAGESDNGSLRVVLDRQLKLEFHGSRITSDAGLLAYRELDDALGLSNLAGAALSECRRGKNIRHLLTALLRQAVFGRPAGQEDVNDCQSARKSGSDSLSVQIG